MSDYTPSGNPATDSDGSSSDMRAEFDLIRAAISTKADSDSPTLTTPALGVATATSINKIVLTGVATLATLTLLDGKTLTVNKTLTLDGTDGTVMTFPAASATIARTDAAQTFTGTQTFSGLIEANLGLTVAGAAFNSRGITDNATAKALTLSGSGANSVTIANSATNPAIGTSGGNLQLAPATGSVFLNSGATNYIQVYGNTTGNAPGFAAIGGDTNVALALATKGTSPIQFVTNSTVEQVRVNHTASADRYITLTGSAGGNPTIGTSAGNLAISSAVTVTGSITGSANIICADGSAFVFGAATTAYVAGSSASNVISLYTNSAEQVRVTNTASANRYITLSGSNGGNPTIGTSAGALQLSSGAVPGAESYIYSASNLSGSTPALASITGVLIGANRALGNGDVSLFNSYYTAAISFDFRQITASGVSASVVRMLPISGGTAGIVFVQGSAATNARIGTDAASNIIIGAGTALATTATTNHMMIPTCAGTPTGVPVDAAEGRLPMIYDTSNNFLYFYNGGWKKSTAYA